MTDKDTKILIVIDGTEELENSLSIVTDTNLLKCNQVVLFFILNPFNPITEGQQKEVLHNDFVHDQGRRLASLYIEKLETIIHEKNPDIRVTSNLVNAYENLEKRLGLDDINLTLCSIKFSHKLDFGGKASCVLSRVGDLVGNITLVAVSKKTEKNQEKSQEKAKK